MSKAERLRHAGELLDQGKSDEETERCAGVSLVEVLVLRARRAAAPAKPVRVTGSRTTRA